MSAVSSVTDVPATAPVQVGACAVCPHALTDHDRISLRFCRATEVRRGEGATTRGCVCPT